MNFRPSSGLIIVDPINKVKKSSYVEVADGVDDPHQGYVVAIGDHKPYEQSPEHFLESPAKIGDLVLYSIVGIEKIRIPYGDDPRHEFVVVPFIRCLGVLNVHK